MFKHRVIPKTEVSQISVLVQIERLQLWERKLVGHVPYLIHVQVKLLKMRKLVYQPLERVNIRDVILAQLNDLEHEVVLKTFDFCDSVERKV